MRFAAVVFIIGDKIALQRRDHKAPNDPNVLGVFGGLIESGEEPAEAIRREIAEETSLDIAKLKIQYMFDVQIPVSATNPEIGVDSVFKCQLDSLNFEVKEGLGVEVHTLEELINKTDIQPATKIILKKLHEEKKWL